MAAHALNSRGTQRAPKRSKIYSQAGITQLIATSYIVDADPLDGLMQATDTQVFVEGHSRVYSDRQVEVTGGALTTEDDGTTALVAEKTYHGYYDDETRAGGAVALKLTRDSTLAATSDEHPFRHYLGSIVTDVAGGTGTSAGGSVPPGWSGGDFRVEP
jgi:hypothetical protein